VASAMFAKGLRFLPASVREAMKLFTNLSYSVRSFFLCLSFSKSVI